MAVGFVLRQPLRLAYLLGWGTFPPDASPVLFLFAQEVFVRDNPFSHVLMQ